MFGSGLDVTMIGLDVTHRAVTTPAVQERLRATGRVGAFVAELVDFFSVYHRETTAGTARRSTTRSPSRTCLAGPRHDRPAQRRGRARVRALPRPHGRRPLEPHRPAEERPRRRRPRHRPLLRPARAHGLGSARVGSCHVGRDRLRGGAFGLAQQVRARPGARALVLDRRLFTSMTLPGRLRVHRGDAR